MEVKSFHRTLGKPQFIKFITVRRYPTLIYFSLNCYCLPLLDYRGCRTRHDYWSFYWGCWWEYVLLLLNFFMFQIHFAQCWRNFLGCSRGVGIFLVLTWDVLELSRVLNTPWFFQGVNTVCEDSNYSKFVDKSLGISLCRETMNLYVKFDNFFQIMSWELCVTNWRDIIWHMHVKIGSDLSNDERIWNFFLNFVGVKNDNIRVSCYYEYGELSWCVRKSCHVLANVTNLAGVNILAKIPYFFPHILLISSSFL